MALGTRSSAHEGMIDRLYSFVLVIFHPDPSGEYWPSSAMFAVCEPSCRGRMVNLLPFRAARPPIAQTTYNRWIAGLTNDADMSAAYYAAPPITDIFSFPDRMYAAAGHRDTKATIAHAARELRQVH
jgi:hypothetical protein